MGTHPGSENRVRDVARTQGRWRCVPPVEGICSSHRLRGRLTVTVWAAYAGLLALLAGIAPIGLVLLRLGERVFPRISALHPLERLLVAGFASGTLFFTLASLPFPVFYPAVVVGALGAGLAVMAYLWVRERGRSFRAGIDWVSTWTGAGIVLGFLALLGIEVLGTGTLSFPNTYDGSFQTLFAQVILQHHGVTDTLLPYANVGVEYPQGAAVWLTLPPMLFGWSLVSSPLLLPALFLALSLPAAYSWGRRWGGAESARGTRVGLLFAGFFALVASWPRLFVGGSYDFAFALPLVFLAFGWLRPFVEPGVPNWPSTVAFGLLLGAITSLSVAAGEMLALTTVAFWIVYSGRRRARLLRAISRFAVLVAIGAAFVIRSLAGVVMWYSYPQHVLAPVGSPPYAIPGVPTTASVSTFIGELDPFVPLKPKLSPFPVLSVVLAILLAIGLVLCVLRYLTSHPTLARGLPKGVVGPAMITALVAFVWTAFLVLATTPALGATVFDYLASLYEASFLLFICYQVLALLPLLVLVENMGGRRGSGRALPTPPKPREHDPKPRWSLPAGAPTRPSSTTALAVVALAIPFGIGAGVTATQVPSYLHDHVLELANVTIGDAQALEWAGSHLPVCSRVFAAPGSAAMFLPLYSDAQLVFPMMPLPVNLSYNEAVDDLAVGVYSTAVHSALVELGITVVFVTAQNSASYPPLEPGPLESSPDFTLLYSSGDAKLFEFVPGVAATGCPV